MLTVTHSSSPDTPFFFTTFVSSSLSSLFLFLPSSDSNLGDLRPSADWSGLSGALYSMTTEGCDRLGR